MQNLLETTTHTAAYSAIIVTAVEAIRARWPSLDGWRVLLVAGVIAIILGLLSVTDLTAPDILQAARVAVLSWVVAVGGNAWVSKIAGRIGGET